VKDTSAHGPSVSIRGNGLKLVDAVVLSTHRELRAYVVFQDWIPTGVEIRLHHPSRERGRKRAGLPPYGFRPVTVPIEHVTDVQVLLARALDCARQPLRELTPYAED
jgi:hypothetical protein